MPMLRWRDKTRYTVEELAHSSLSPRAWSLRLHGGTYIVVSKELALYPGVWMLHCPPWYDRPVPIATQSSDTIDVIRLRALRNVEERLRYDSADAADEIAKATIVIKR